MDTENKFEELEMGELLSQHTQKNDLSQALSQGQIVQAHVVQITDQGVLVDVGLKTEAVIPRSEFGAELPSELQMGAEVPVMRRSGQTADGHPLVSYRRAKEITSWAHLQEALAKGHSVEGKVIQKIKGGFVVDVGIPAFLPASQMELRPVKNSDQWLGKSVSVYVLELDAAKNNAVVSRRKYLETQNQAAKEETLKDLSVGQIKKGKVISLTSYGAFVDLGGIEGLLHISDLSWQRVARVKDVVSVGQEIPVMVLKYDAATQKISLGLKQLTPHPWKEVPERFPVGTTLTGKVVNLAPFGAFVEVAAGVEGLLHLSELSWTQRVHHPKELLKVGQTITVKVIELDSEKEKLSLSFRQTQPNPWEQAQAEYNPGVKLQGKVTHLTNFGAFVMLPIGLEGLVHVSDISWAARPPRPEEVFSVGAEVEVRVLGVDAKAQRISLGFKQLTPDPFKKYHVGSVVEGTIQQMTGRGAVLKSPDGLECFLPAAEYSSDPSLEKTPSLAVGQKVTAQVFRIHRKERLLDVSVKRYEKDQERSMIKKYLSENSGKPSLGDILLPSEEE